MGIKGGRRPTTALVEEHGEDGNMERNDEVEDGARGV